MLARFVAAAAAVSISFVGSLAFGAKPHEYGWERPSAVSLHLGLRTPLGVGVAYEIAPVPELPLEVGAGFTGDGVQIGAVERVRIPLRSLAVSLGAGVSRGAYSVGNNDCVVWFGPCSAVGSGVEYTWSAAVWANYEISLEHRSRSGFQYRFFWGFRKLLNTDTARCEELMGGFPAPRNCAPSEYMMPYFGLSLGYAFFL